MTNKQYGLKEVANVTFYEVGTGVPKLFFDTLKVSTIENESESAEARGGQGNGRLMSWDYGRTSTLTLQDALLSDKSLAALAGNQIETTDVILYAHEEVEVDNIEANTITLKNAPIEGSVHAYELSNGAMQDADIVDTVTENAVTIKAVTTDANKVIVFYQYAATAGDDVSQVVFSANAFPDTYKVVGETIVRGRDGKNRAMQFVIEQAKLQSSFSLPMDVENVATFDFNLEVLIDPNSDNQQMYRLIRIGKPLDEA